jgi:hypothetical protein
MSPALRQATASDSRVRRKSGTCRPEPAPGLPAAAGVNQPQGRFRQGNKLSTATIGRARGRNARLLDTHHRRTAKVSRMTPADDTISWDPWPSFHGSLFTTQGRIE